MDSDAMDSLDSDATYVNDLLDHNIDQPLSLNEIIVDVNELKTLIGSIDISKSSCIKNISSKICRDLMTFIPDKFCKLFNASLASGIFPRIWSIGYVNVIP